MSLLVATFHTDSVGFWDLDFLVAITTAAAACVNAEPEKELLIEECALEAKKRRAMSACCIMSSSDMLV